MDIHTLIESSEQPQQQHTTTHNNTQQQPGAGHRVVVEGLSSQSVRPFRGLTGEARSQVVLLRTCWLVTNGENRKVWGVVVPGCPQGENLFSLLDAAGDWVTKGSYHTAWAVPLRFLMHLFICVWARPSYRATHWRAVLATACRCVEGYRTPDAALVC